MEKSLTIDVWGDVVCPFCYLGLAQLGRAMDEFEHADSVVVTHHAFELDPHATTFAGSLDEMLAAKYGLPLDRAAALNQRVINSAAELGMAWHLEVARPTNTFDAHRLIALASSQGQQAKMLERLFRAYFSEGHLVSDHQTLARLAEEVGVTDASSVLADDEAFAAEVRRDEAVASQIGITGVPAFILNRRFVVSGAQGIDALLDALRSAWSEASLTD
jgi:predicted DsbA family dithiol-disulfide isomerase